MIKFFFLFLLAWLWGLPGANGLLLIFLYGWMLYSVRYRGYRGRISKKEYKSISLKKEARKQTIRGQWDVVPWPGTSKHVIRKWNIDRIALKTRLPTGVKEVQNGLHLALKRLDYLVTNTPRATSIKYNRTLSVFDTARRTHTNANAVALVKSILRTKSNKWTDHAIASLGGAFIICAESYKGDIRQYFQQKGTTAPRMASTTVAAKSRLTWTVGQIFQGRLPGGFGVFMKTLLQYMNPWDAHAVVQYKGSDYYAPTTFFGASATIMKVMSLCEFIGLDRKHSMLVGYCVALHWIDKYLMDDSWTEFTIERHSLIEALQGMYAYIDNNPEHAAKELVRMYIDADNGKLKKKYGRVRWY